MDFGLTFQKKGIDLSWNQNDEIATASVELCEAREQTTLETLKSNYPSLHANQFTATTIINNQSAVWQRIMLCKVPTGQQLLNVIVRRKSGPPFLATIRTTDFANNKTSVNQVIVRDMHASLVTFTTPKHETEHKTPENWPQFMKGWPCVSVSIFPLYERSLLPMLASLTPQQWRPMPTLTTRAVPKRPLTYADFVGTPGTLLRAGDLKMSLVLHPELILKEVYRITGSGLGVCIYPVPEPYFWSVQ